MDSLTSHYRQERPPAIKVLMYHRTLRDDDQDSPTPFAVHVRDFLQHLELLDRWGFTTITFKELRLCMKGELNYPKKPVILTFDDGYADTHEIAFPCLAQYGMKAVVFVQGDRRIKRSDWDAAEGLPSADLMSDRQILELHASGFEIGSHTMSHPRLTELPREQAWDEISNSRISLEILLNDTIETFAYPYGLQNREIKKMVSDAGYLCACGVSSGPPRFLHDPYDIRRIFIPSSLSIPGFALRMLTPSEYYDWTRTKIRGLFGSNKRKAGNNHVSTPTNGRKHSSSQRTTEYDAIQS